MDFFLLYDEISNIFTIYFLINYTSSFYSFSEFNDDYPKCFEKYTHFIVYNRNNKDNLIKDIYKYVEPNNIMNKPYIILLNDEVNIEPLVKLLNLENNKVITGVSNNQDMQSDEVDLNHIPEIYFRDSSSMIISEEDLKILNKVYTDDTELSGHVGTYTTWGKLKANHRTIIIRKNDPIYQHVYLSMADVGRIIKDYVNSLDIKNETRVSVLLKIVAYLFERDFGKELKIIDKSVKRLAVGEDKTWVDVFDMWKYVNKDVFSKLGMLEKRGNEAVKYENSFMSINVI